MHRLTCPSIAPVYLATGDGRLSRVDKQTEFVLRAIEERDVRFVRMWFTDVLGLPEVGGDRAGRAGGRVRRGHGLRRLGHRGLRPGLRVGHGRPPRPGHLPGAAVARHQPGHRPDVLRHLDARRLTLVRRPALRAQAGAEEGGRPRLHLLHPPRGRVLPVQGPAAARACRRCRSTSPATSTTPRRAWAATSAARRSPCWSRWGSRSSSPTTRAARASRRSTCATPTRCPPRTT